VHRHSRVDHRVDEHDRAAGDLGIEVLQEPDPVAALAVPRQLDEVERVVAAEPAREVADERDARLQRPDEQRLLAFVVPRQLGGQLADASADLVGVEEDLADALVELDQWLRKPSAARSGRRDG
jgi:hypothetical protein